MAATLAPTRGEISPRHSVLGFTVRTGTAGPSWFEVVLATDPTLLDPAARPRRALDTFGRSGLQYSERGDAVYLVPPALLERFQGKERLYYALATYTRPDDPAPE